MTSLIVRKTSYLIREKSVNLSVDLIIVFLSIGFYEKYYGIDQVHFTYL